MDYYERYYTDYEEAKRVKKETHGKIDSFISTDENGNPITVYVVRYKQLF